VEKYKNYKLSTKLIDIVFCGKTQAIVDIFILNHYIKEVKFDDMDWPKGYNKKQIVISLHTKHYATGCSVSVTN
jgi:hypothetical protein